MSWKIYDAYKFNGSFPELMIEPEGIRKIHREIAFDRAVNGFLKYYTDKGKAALTYMEVWQNVNLSNGYGTPREDDPPRSCIWELDTRGQAAIYPRHSGLYVQFFSDDAVLRRLSSKFKDWHWQNSTDRPANISGKEWGCRERFWKGVFSGCTSPSDVALMKQFSDWNLVHAVEKMICWKLWPDKTDKPEPFIP